jgi:hypothetical protein
MRKFTTIILLAIAFTNCKKENQITPQPKDNSLKSITSVNYGYREYFDFTNGLLSDYAVDIYGTGEIVFEIDYDHRGRAVLVKKNGELYAFFFYHINSVSLYVDDGLVDSLHYILDTHGNISSLERFDNFHGSMLKNAQKTYLYAGYNLIEIESTEYNPNGSKKLIYKESAIYDNGKNAFEPIHENVVLLELLFSHIPSRIFTVNSKNNITSIESNHPSDGYTMTQSINYNSLGKPSEITFIKDQYGYIDQDIELFSYQE